jgi:hypothetical protein
MLFRKAIPPRGIRPYGLNVSLKTLLKLLCAVVTGTLVVNKRMMHCDMGGTWLEVSAVF